MDFLDLPAKLNDFLIILLSILVEGIPFILIGAIISGFVEIWLSKKDILKILPKNKFLQFVSMGLLGNVLPVCECGNVPLARRMILKKVPHHLAITFLLSAPVLNPIVILATIAAFSNDLSILFYRILFTLIIAISLGYIFSFISKEKVLNPKLSETPDDHHHTHQSSKLDTVLKITKREFIEMMSVFLIGATIAASIQNFFPKSFILSFNQTEWLSIIAMMVLAFTISICSNVDSFFALAYAQIFPTSSILAFLVLGPMIDIKAIPMFKTIFSWKTVYAITAYVFLSTFLLTYIYYLLT